MIKRKIVFLLFSLLVSGPVLLVAQVARFIPAKTNVTYPSLDGTTTKGYLARPSQGNNAPGNGQPAVLMIHEWWGLNEDITRLADALAAQGYVVLAPDLFRGNLATSAENALRQSMNTPSEQLRADRDGALKFLMTRPEVDATRVAVQGFCFGGTQAMLMGTSHPELSGVVIFYGPSLITEPSQLGVMPKAGPVLGVFGDQDSNIPVSQVRAFEQALNAVNVVNTVVIYQGVGHAFVNSDNYNKGSTPQQAWDRMIQFLNNDLKK